MDEAEESTLETARSRVGSTLSGKWRLDALLGIGGMAAVYVATHRNGRRAALKMLRPELAANRAARRRFLQEGYAANRVAHPGAVAVLDDDDEDGAPFLVMELLEGETLASRWASRGRRLGVIEVLDTFDEVLDVLAAAHEKGIVHRDIKPDNIFVCDDGQIKVLDFGIARVAELAEGAHLTRSNATLGTPAFMAPEQARGRRDEVGVHSDIWSVGAAMFTSITGAHVHEGGTVNEVLIAAATQLARPVAGLCPDLPRGVASIVDRALRFDPSARWPSARAMQEAIRSQVAELEASGAPSSRRARRVEPAIDAFASTLAEVEKPASERAGFSQPSTSKSAIERSSERRWSLHLLLPVAALVALVASISLTQFWLRSPQQPKPEPAPSMTSDSEAPTSAKLEPRLDPPRVAPTLSAGEDAGSRPDALPERASQKAAGRAKVPVASPVETAAVSAPVAPSAPPPAITATTQASATAPLGEMLDRRK